MGKIGIWTHAVRGRGRYIGLDYVYIRAWNKLCECHEGWGIGRARRDGVSQDVVYFDLRRGWVFLEDLEPGLRADVERIAARFRRPSYE